MGIFARRYLQRCLDESLTFATRQARELWVDKLNSPSSLDYAATEWELVVLHGLSKLGQLRHEENLGGISHPDVWFAAAGLEFVADVTAVSDKGLHEQNPVEMLEGELRRRYMALGIDSGGFALVVTATSISYKRKKTCGYFRRPTTSKD